MKINMDEWAKDIIAAPDVRCLPVLYFPCVSLTGKKVGEVVNDAELHYQGMAAVIKRFPAMIGSMVGMDLTKEAEAFGAQVKVKENDVPSVENELVTDRASIENLQVPSIETGRVPIFIEAAKLAAQRITDRPTFGGVLGPFSLAAVLMGLERTLKSLKKDPETVHMLMEKCTRYCIDFCQAYKDAGANGVLLAEPTAGIISKQQCDEFSSRYVKRIVDAVQDEYFFIVLHNCGNVTKMVPSMVITGAKGYHFGNAVDMAEILPQVPEHYLAFGNVDPSRVLSKGTPEKVAQVTREVLKKGRKYPHFVLSSGCDIPPGTPLENLDALFKTMADFNKQQE